MVSFSDWWIDACMELEQRHDEWLARNRGDMTLPPHETERVAMLLGTVPPTSDALHMAKRISERALAEAKRLTPIRPYQERAYDSVVFKAVWQAVTPSQV